MSHQQNLARCLFTNWRNVMCLCAKISCVLFPLCFCWCVNMLWWYFIHYCCFICRCFQEYCVCCLCQNTWISRSLHKYIHTLVWIRSISCYALSLYPCCCWFFCCCCGFCCYYVWNETHRKTRTHFFSPIHKPKK